MPTTRINDKIYYYKQKGEMMDLDEQQRKKNKKSTYKDFITRMLQSYDKNKDKMNDDAPKRNDSVERQRKIDDLEKRSNGKVSWKGLK